MEMTPEEFTAMMNVTNESLKQAKELGAREQREKPRPKSLFDSFLKHAEKAGTLIDYCHQKDMKWIQLKPERNSNKNCEYVEIGFSEDGMSVDLVWAGSSKDHD